MKLKVVCCCCQAVKQEGDPGAPVSHTYCRICGAAVLRQLDIWDYTENQELLEALEGENNELQNMRGSEGELENRTQGLVM